MIPDVGPLVEKGRRSLSAGRRDFDEGDFDLAVSRAYYAMFHLAVALLHTKGLEFRRHSAVVAAFAQHFVGPRQFTIDHHAALVRAFNERNIADYRYERPVSQRTAREILDLATRFLDDAEAYLRNVPGEDS